MAYLGNPIVSTDFPKDTFSGNGSTTAFTMQIAPASVNSVIVVVSGITQDPSTYTISGTTLTFSAAPPSGTSNISVRHLGVAGTPQVPALGSVVSASLATADLAINGVTVGKGGGSQSANTAVGASAMAATASGNYNTAYGYTALGATTSGTQNTALGGQAMNTNTTGSYNVGVGVNALQQNTSGSYNIAIGVGALPQNTTASNNTAVGYQAGYNNTTGNQNTAVGVRALYNNTTALNNVAIGLEALNNSNYTADTAANNTSVGTQSGRATTTGKFNSFFGIYAGYGNTTGSYNTYVGAQGSTGYGCGELMTTGSKNTILGSFNGNQGGVDIRVSNNNIVLSDGDGNPRAMHYGNEWNFKASNNTNSSCTWDGYELFPQPDNSIKLGFPAFRWTVVYATTGTINTSDANQKQQIRSLDVAEKEVATRIKGLIKAFKWNDSVAEKGDDARIHVGVIAQEVQAAFIAEGLDPSKYGMFCSDTWYEVDGAKISPANPYTADTEGAVEVTQLGIRYDQLLSFVIAAL